jgi:hypothetical protein
MCPRGIGNHTAIEALNAGGAAGRKNHTTYAKRDLGNAVGTLDARELHIPAPGNHILRNPASFETK